MIRVHMALTLLEVPQTREVSDPLEDLLASFGMQAALFYGQQNLKMSHVIHLPLKDRLNDPPRGL